MSAVVDCDIYFDSLGDLGQFPQRCRRFSYGVSVVGKDNSIGIAIGRRGIGLENLVYNLFRFRQLNHTMMTGRAQTLQSQ